MAKKNGVEVILFNEKKCLDEKHIELQLQHSNLYSSELKKKTKIARLWQISALQKVFNRRFWNSGKIRLQKNTCSKF